MADTTTVPSSSAGASHASGVVPPSRHADGPELLHRVAAGAHETIDRIADKAAPAAHRLESGMARAHDTLHNEAHRLREIGNEWRDGVRDGVRERPLTSLLLAVAVGALIARITR